MLLSIDCKSAQLQDPRSRSMTKCLKKKQAAKAEVQRCLDAGFIREVTYPQ
jgi:hypothetical protein